MTVLLLELTNGIGLPDGVVLDVSEDDKRFFLHVLLV